MQTLVKFAGPDLDASHEFVHPNVWEREEGPGWSRLVIGARSGEIPLILELCRSFEGPFSVLYVLVVSRIGHEECRYQVPQPVNYEDLELFLYTFQEFFEQDGRHHLWVACEDGFFVFDNHNVIYAYGDLDTYEAHLERSGFDRGSVDTPYPHSHCYHFQFDSTEDEVLGYWQWKKSPLQPQDTP